MDMFEPTGFGRFDSSIFGLRLNLDRAIVEPYDPDLLRLTLESFHRPIGEEHRKYIERLSDPARKSLAVSLFTLSCHETKHFHDLLLTPYGSVLMRQYTRFALLSLSCSNDLFIRNDTIMLPLSDWVSDWELYNDVSPPLREPSENIRELTGVIETMLTKLRVFDRGIYDLPDTMSHLTASSILEGLAIIVQERAIISTFGEDGLQAFRQIFDNVDSVKRYYGALSTVLNFFDSRPTTDSISLLLLSSLYGNFQDENPARPRYPKDLLVKMLLWLKEHRPRVFSSPLPSEVFACVDEYFEQELGDDLQGMATQAAKANGMAHSEFSEIAANYAKHSRVDGERGAQILKLFTNFRNVQAAASSNVMINPTWYVSSEYNDNFDILPSPVMYVETDSGFPVDDNLEKFYYVQSESRLDVSGLSTDVKLRLNLSADAKVVRGAHRLAPRFRISLEEPARDRRPPSFMFEMPELDLPLWHKQYDEIYGLLRSLIEGFDGRMLNADRRELDFLFAFVRVRIYSNGRLRDPVELPLDWQSEAVHPVFREMMWDERFVAALDDLRTGRLRQKPAK